MILRREGVKLNRKQKINPCSVEPVYTLPFVNSVDPDRLASEEAN